MHDANGRPPITTAQRRAWLATRHRLVPSARTDDVVAIADDLVALHSSDPVTVYLSATVRMVHPDLAPVAAALYDERTLVRHHAMRRTLWVMTPDVARDAHRACTVVLAARERTRLVQLLEQNGVSDGAGWLAAARRDTLDALDAHGPMTARALGKLVPALRTPLVMSAGKAYSATVAAHTRVLLVLGFEGAIVRTRPTGTWINGEYCWAPAQEWIPGGLTGPAGEAADEAADVAAGRLAARWLHSFGPAPASDLQWWAGWSGATTSRALRAAGSMEVDLDGEVGHVLPADLDAVRSSAAGSIEPWVAVLPGLDPTTMGWKRRDWFLPAVHASHLFDRNGNAGPTIWVDGRVVGGWVQRRDGSIAHRLLEPLDRSQRSAIEASLERVRSTLGDTRFTVRFPQPLQRELLDSAD